MQVDEKIGAEEPVDLANCDREPIHLLGRIQSFGFFLAFSSDWSVRFVSDNAPEWVGRKAEECLGIQLQDLIVEESFPALRQALLAGGTPDLTERIYGLHPFAGSDACDVSLHRHGDTVIAEFEPSGKNDGSMTRELMSLATAGQAGRRSMMALCRKGVESVHRLTGFDRVMLYRFLEDGSGDVVTEIRKPEAEPFEGLRYPATDIPKQARALYLRNRIRIIANVHDEGAIVVPSHSPEGKAPDLSDSTLRSVSPIHIEYLKNMGVAASLSISVIVDGELWGLIACHHDSPRTLSLQTREIAELFGQIFSLELENHIRGTLSMLDERANVLQNRLMTDVAQDMSISDALRAHADQIRAIIPHDGMAIISEGDQTLIGSTPDRNEIDALIRFLNRASTSRVYSTRSLMKVHEPAAAYRQLASGLLAVPISRDPRDYVLFFRREIAESVTWAGNPDKPVKSGPNGARLTPRGSFTAWRQIVEGHSAAWSAQELRVAEQFRIALIEIVLRLTGFAAQERKAAQERQEVLIAELNHRVKNILALIKGIVGQTAIGTQEIETYVQNLGRRIHSLARAHDQITARNWESASFLELLSNEVSAYGEEDQNRLDITGDDVMLSPNAYTSMALVLHEMVTNASKYGAFSNGEGRIAVQLSRDPNQRLIVDWTESDGPHVEPPVRRGFGSTIIERAIPFDLRGEAQVRYLPEGVSARFEIPAAHLFDGPLKTRGSAGRSEPQKKKPELSGMALLVEDNMIIAMDAEDVLMQIGADKVAVAANVARALDAIGENDFAIAALDINLGDENSFPIADALRKRGVPYIFCSGYGENGNIPEEHRDVPVVTKPYGLESLSEAIYRVIS